LIILIFKEKQMLLNLSNNSPENQERIEQAIGKSFDLKTRQEIGGVDSGLLVINEANVEIINLLVLNEGLNTCNVEIREDGVLIRFQANMEPYALVIPFYKLKLNKGQAQQYTFFIDHYFLKLKADRKEIHEFMRRVRKQKYKHWTSQSFRD